MSDTNKTVTDVIREIRAEADYIEKSARGSLKAGETLAGTPFTESDLESALDLAETKRKEANRLEAALKRELSKNTSKNGADFGQLGNAAATREALSDACYAMFNFLKSQTGGYEEMANALDKAKAALAAPPRNCDLPNPEERYSEFCSRYQSCSCCPHNRPAELRCDGKWLLAPATEKEGAKK